ELERRAKFSQRHARLLALDRQPTAHQVLLDTRLATPSGAEGPIELERCGLGFAGEAVQTPKLQSSERRRLGLAGVIDHAAQERRIARGTRQAQQAPRADDLHGGEAKLVALATRSLDHRRT